MAGQQAQQRRLGEHAAGRRTARLDRVELAAVQPPQVARGVDGRARHHAGDAGRRGRGRGQRLEAAGRGVEPGQALAGDGPVAAAAVLQPAEDDVGRQARGPAPVVHVAVADPAMETLAGRAQPQRAVAVHQQAAHGRVGQAVVAGPGLPGPAVPAGDAGRRGHQDAAAGILDEGTAGLPFLVHHRRLDGLEALGAGRQAGQVAATARPQATVPADQQRRPGFRRQALRGGPQRHRRLASVPGAQAVAAAEPEAVAELPQRDRLDVAGRRRAVEGGHGEGFGADRGRSGIADRGCPEPMVAIDRHQHAALVDVELAVEGHVQRLAVGAPDLHPVRGLTALRARRVARRAPQEQPLVGGQPEPAEPVDTAAPDAVADRDRQGLAVDPEAVETEQAVLGADPQHRAPVLREAGGGEVLQALAFLVGGQHDALGARGQGQKRRQQCQGEGGDDGEEREVRPARGRRQAARVGGWAA